eukprot:403336698
MNVCYRCIFMLFREYTLQIYRLEDFNAFRTEVGLPENLICKNIPLNKCTICLGVNQFCDNPSNLENVITLVKQQGFEFQDFKITFSISIIAYINKIIAICEAEQKNALDFKEIYKWIMSPKIARRLDVPANLEGTFLVNVNFCNRDVTAINDQNSEVSIIETLQQDLTDLGISQVKNQYGAKWKNKKQQEKDDLRSAKTQMGAEQIIQLLSKTPISLLKELKIVKNLLNQNIDLMNLIQVECSQESMLLFGRYIKHSREVSQTPWLIGDREIKNLQDEISVNLMDVFGSKTVYLHAAGREDIDVRMLGIGRPFVCEFINPKFSISVKDRVPEMQGLVTSDVVFCHDFKIVDKKFFDDLKDIENSKAKAYCCVVWLQRRITKKELEKRLNSLVDIEIKQITPIRVLHRRSLMVRDKQIYKVHAEYINQHYFVLHVLASAGTYIKEFVHGDLGRTTPSIGSILESEADILQLDVTQVYDSVHQVDLTNENWHKIQYIDRE